MTYTHTFCPIQSLNTVTELVAWLHLAQRGNDNGQQAAWGAKSVAAPAYADLVSSMWAASPQVGGEAGGEVFGGRGADGVGERGRGG